MKHVVNHTAVIVLAMWIGAALLLVTSVAPAAFAVLPTRTLAGALVGRVLPAVFIAGMVAAALAIAVLVTGKFLKVLPSAVMFVCCVGAQFVVAPRIAKLRAEIGGAVDALAIDDPKRVLFGDLHATSVAYLGGAILCAAITLVLLLLARRPQPLELSNG